MSVKKLLDIFVIFCCNVLNLSLCSDHSISNNGVNAYSVQISAGNTFMTLSEQKLSFTMVKLMNHIEQN